MDDVRIKKLVEALMVGSLALESIARTAKRGRKSIDRGSYGDRFHAEAVKLTKVEREVLPVLRSITSFDAQPLEGYLAAARSTSTDLTARERARKQIRMICEVEILPNIGNLGSPVQPTSEPVIAAAVLAKAPTYLQRTLLQANGCYEKRWFDPCSVMIRKLVENLIIDVYEKHKFQAEIQDKNGNYFMLGDLVTAMLSQTHWQLQRETKRALPDIKKLGDRAAHNRRYEATRSDVDQLLPGLRATADDLLHLAGHK